MYHVYYIKGVKVGCTNNLKKRVEQEQGYSEDEYQVLFSTKCITTAAKKEKHFQEVLGYKVDNIRYDEMPSNKLSVKFAKGTITFGKSTDVITAERLLSLESIKDDSKEFLDYEIKITNEVAKWILNNLKSSQYGFGQFVYLNAIKKKFSVEITEEPKEESVFDNIRSWATERGLYEKGDVKTQYVKLMEEAGELAQSILKEDEPEIKDAIGDMVVVLTNLANLQGLTIEDCISSAYDEIKDRKGKMDNGTFKKQ